MLAIKVLGIKPGDEVIVPSMTFVASANAVELAGATPVLIDSEPRTGLLDMDALEDAIRPGTTAILPVPSRPGALLTWIGSTAFGTAPGSS